MALLPVLSRQELSSWETLALLNTIKTKLNVKIPMAAIVGM